MYLTVAATEEELPRFNDGECITRPVGIGLVESALHTAHLIEHYNPEMVFCTGSCGAVDPALKISDVIIASVVHHYGFSTPFPYTPAPMPLHQVEHLLSNGKYPFKVTSGVTLGSADIFLDQDRYSMLSGELQARGIQAVDMESYAVAAACRSRGVDCVVIRYVSDSREEGRVKAYKSFLSKMKEHASLLIKDILERAEREVPYNLVDPPVLHDR